MRYSFEDLDVWRLSCRLTTRLYGVLKESREYWLKEQLLRSALSIPSNIAEGQARHTTGEFIQFISHAEGSLAELDTQLILSIELRFCRDRAGDPAFELIDELRRMLYVLRRKLAARQ